MCYFKRLKSEGALTILGPYQSKVRGPGPLALYPLLPGSDAYVCLCVSVCVSVYLSV